MANWARTTQPLAITLRYLQTLSEIAIENNSTTLFPIPIDLFEPLIRAKDRAMSSLPPPTAPTTLPGGAS